MIFNLIKVKFWTVTALLLLSLLSFSQTVDWIKSGSGPASNQINSVQTDLSGNIYISGSYHDTLSFADTNLYSSYFQSYIAKLNPLGIVLWIKKIDSMVKGCKVDKDGYLYLFGYYNSMMTASPYSNDTLQGVNNSYIMRFDTNGNFIWVKQIGSGSGYEIINDICIDGDGYIYIAGNITHTAHFGNYTLVSNPYNSDMFIAKYDNTGACLWVKQSNTDFNADACSLSLSAFGELYVTGYFRGTAFGGISSHIDSLGYITEDMFIAKYHNNGNLIWAKGAGGDNTDSGRKVVTEDNGNCYVAGRMLGTATFGENTNQQIITGDFGSYFLAKYDNEGNLNWVRDGSSLSEVFVGGLTIDQNGLYISGTFGAKINVNGNEYTVSGQSGLRSDIYIVKYDYSGQFKWFKQSTSNLNYSFASCSSIISDNTENIYLTGTYNNDILFDGFIIDDSDNDDYGNNGFIIKLKDEQVIGISEMNSENQFLIYPNPTGGFIVITNLSDDPPQLKISVKNQLGQIIYTSLDFNLQQKIIDFTKQRKGIYFVEVISDDLRSVKKVVVN
ncbi:MAG: hypothetical protein K0S44_319 [Bacteroidetes bacterium]|jgi:hypothetical protein|nr:hypothetical protein [Bacteroidota bacterium]